MKNKIARIFSFAMALAMIPNSVHAENKRSAPLKVSAVTVDEQLTHAFHANGQFAGADGACSIPLDEKTTLWLFGDTFVRKSKAILFINNSCAVQNIESRKMTFFWRTDRGKPASLLGSRDRTKVGLYCWPGDGFILGEKLFILNKIIAPIKTDEKNPNDLNFDWVADELTIVGNAGDAPDKWDAHSLRLQNTEEIRLGTACLTTPDFVYFYSSIKSKAAGVHPHPTGVARIARKSLLSGFKQSDIAYWDGAGWDADSTKSQVLFEDGASEMTVTDLRGEPYLVATYMPPLSGNIRMRFAKAPQGPWSEPINVYQCPESKIQVLDHQCSVYSAKAHPEFAKQKGEVVVSYCSNPGDLKHYQNRPDLYYPHIIRVLLERAH